MSDRGRRGGGRRDPVGFERGYRSPEARAEHVARVALRLAFELGIPLHQAHRAAEEACSTYWPQEAP